MDRKHLMRFEMKCFQLNSSGVVWEEPKECKLIMSGPVFF